ncbi:MAG: lysylphosphatidylglycerol synthase domain-containing protein [Candidatus Saccharimonadales bacterium]
MKFIEVVVNLLRRIPKRIIGLIFAVLVVAFFALYLRSVDWQRLAHLHFAWGYLLAATGFALITRYLFVVIWRFILTDLGAKKLPHFRIMADVYARAWMGRYIPGTVTWIAGKVYLAASHGISKSRLAVSSLLEGGMQVIAILVVAMALLGFDTRLSVIPGQYKILMIIVAVGLLIALSPPAFNRIIRLGFFIIKKRQPDGELRINGKAALRAFALYAMSGFILGVSEFFISRTIAPSLPWRDFFYVIGAFNLAGAIGILAIGVPSGLGVRDGILLVLLAAIMPKEIALAITVTSRLWSALVDVLFFSVAALARRLGNNYQKPPLKNLKSVE